MSGFEHLFFYEIKITPCIMCELSYCSILHPSKMLSGTLAMSAAGGIFYYLTSSQQSATDFKKNHPLVFMGIMLTLAYFIVYLLGSVAVFLLGILLPLLGEFLFILLASIV